MNQRYVIATSTKVALTGVDVAAVDDAFFKREKKVVVKGSFTPVILIKTSLNDLIGYSLFHR